jgi:hypothetical protein
MPPEQVGGELRRSYDSSAKLSDALRDGIRVR